MYLTLLSRLIQLGLAMYFGSNSPVNWASSKMYKIWIHLNVLVPESKSQPIGLPRSIVCEYNMHIGSVFGVLIDGDIIP